MPIALVLAIGKLAGFTDCLDLPINPKTYCIGALRQMMAVQASCTTFWGFAKIMEVQTISQSEPSQKLSPSGHFLVTLPIWPLKLNQKAFVLEFGT